MGRPESSTRVLVEDCAVTRIDEVPQLPRYDWTFIPVDITTTCGACKQTTTSKLKVAKTPQGPRYLCPKCGFGVKNLYRPPGAAWVDWGCKKCHDLGGLPLAVPEGPCGSNEGFRATSLVRYP